MNDDDDDNDDDGYDDDDNYNDDDGSGYKVDILYGLKGL